MFNLSFNRSSIGLELKVCKGLGNFSKAIVPTINSICSYISFHICLFKLNFMDIVVNNCIKIFKDKIYNVPYNV